ncbi:tetracycline resistance protein, class B [mine drainage metagenome]|uniref:Tetracycline resistance protein, class B n=1 Tax=mine drainage metagenome TaxID=410659 RepID=A0A1J5Q6I7_9ZZZZ
MSSWRTRNLWALSLVSFAQDSASELLYPLIPILLTSVLGAPVAVVGAIEGAAEGAASLTKLLSGKLSDRIRRRPLIFLGYGAAALGKVIVAMSAVWPMVLVGRVVDRLGKGVRSAPRDAMLVENVDRKDRGKVIGFHRAADTFGAVLGPTIGLLALHTFHGDVRKAIWVAVIPATLSVTFVFFARDTRPNVVVGTDFPDPVPLPTRLKRLITVLAVFGLANFPDALLLLRAHEVGFSVTGVVGAYILFNISYALLAFPAGALSDRLPRHVVYSIGLLCFGIAYLGLALTNSHWIVLLLLVVYGGFGACNDAVGKAWVSTLAPDEAQGWAQGLFQGVTGGAIFVAGLWAGLAWNLGQGAGAVPLFVSGVVGLVVAVLLASGRLVKR